MRRILAVRYTPKPDAEGPSWLTVLGHAKDSLWSVDLFRCESAVLRALLGATTGIRAHAWDWTGERPASTAGRERPLREPRCVPLCALSRALSHADRGVKCRPDACGSNEQVGD